MSKIQFNPLVEKLSGSYGKVVFRRWHGELVIAHKPDRTGLPTTPAQAAQRERFRQAVLYAQRTLADPVAARPYQHAAARTEKPLFALTVTDYLVAPKVESVDVSSYTGKSGDPIVIKARDDFEVTGVTVRLTAAGALLEKGAATEDPPGTGRWVYAAQSAAAAGTAVHVTAEAADLAGNKGELSADKTV